MASKVQISYDSEGDSSLDEHSNEENMADESLQEESGNSENSNIDSSENDLDEINDDSNESSSEKTQSGLANVMSKILRKKVKDNKVILAKSKTERELLTLKKNKQEAEPEQSGEKETKDIADKDDVSKCIRDLKRKKWENMSRVKPTVFDKEREKKLQRVATRGVVQLFNAVQKQQKSVKEKLSAVGPSVRKQDIVLKSVKKGDFLDALKKTDIGSEIIPKKSSQDNDDDPSWRILKDDFMMGAKMKDWDKQSDSEGGEEEMQLGDSDSD